MLLATLTLSAFKHDMELKNDGFFTILLALCGGLYHWLRNNLPYYEAEMIFLLLLVVFLIWIAYRRAEMDNK